MSYAEISFIALAVLLVLIPLVWTYIKVSYKKFCAREDQKERIDLVLRKINSARAYVADHYSTPEDRTVQSNLIPKIDFLLKLISHKPLDIQEREYDNLLDMLTETFIRLQTRYDDVTYVLSPLNNLRDRLVREHLDWIKDHMDEADLV